MGACESMQAKAAVTLTVVLTASLLAGSWAAKMPSCEEDTAAHCLGEDADMSPEGIDKCLQGLASRSADCENYLKIVKACSSDLKDGPCARAQEDGEEMLCLIVRTKPAELSADCQASLPKKEEAKGLKKYWADGKRELSAEEEGLLDEEDKDIYKGWHTRKFKGKKNEKSRERDYVVKVAKKERATKLVTEAVANAVKVQGLTDKDDKTAEESALQVVEDEMKKALKEDLTKTLKPFSKSEKRSIARAALKMARKAAKSEM